MENVVKVSEPLKRLLDDDEGAFNEYNTMLTRMYKFAKDMCEQNRNADEIREILKKDSFDFTDYLKQICSEIFGNDTNANDINVIVDEMVIYLVEMLRRVSDGLREEFINHF